MGGWVDGLGGWVGGLGVFSTHLEECDKQIKALMDDGE